VAECTKSARIGWAIAAPFPGDRGRKSDVDTDELRRRLRPNSSRRMAGARMSSRAGAGHSRALEPRDRNAHHIRPFTRYGECVDWQAALLLTFGKRVDLAAQERRNPEIISHFIDEPADGVDRAVSAVVLQNFLMNHKVVKAAKG
jgi:hypothetical protein